MIGRMDGWMDGWMDEGDGKRVRVGLENLGVVRKDAE